MSNPFVLSHTFDYEVIIIKNLICDLIKAFGFNLI